MTETTGTVVDVARKFASLTARKRELAAQQKVLNTELALIERDLIGKLVEEGVAKVSVNTDSDGTWTVSAGTLAWAKLKDGTQKRAMEILKDAGMESLLTINSTKLSGLYREDRDSREYGDAILPDELLALIEVDERTKVSARKT